MKNKQMIIKRKVRHGVLPSTTFRETNSDLGLPSTTFRKPKSGAGFTLIELLVSISIFSLILSAMSGAFISTIQAQRRSVAFQQLLNQTSYLQEYMSRAIRMGKKDISGVCISAKSNYEITRDNKGIKFLNYNRDCQEFYLSNSQLWENKNNVDLVLTSSNLIVENINIDISGNPQTDNLQPRVTIFLKIKGAGSKPEQQPEINIQTTISQRNPDVRY